MLESVPEDKKRQELTSFVKCFFILSIKYLSGSECEGCKISVNSKYFFIVLFLFFIFKYFPGSS